VGGARTQRGLTGVGTWEGESPGRGNSKRKKGCPRSTHELCGIGKTGKKGKGRDPRRGEGKPRRVGLKKKEGGSGGANSWSQNEQCFPPTEQKASELTNKASQDSPLRGFAGVSGSDKNQTARKIDGTVKATKMAQRESNGPKVDAICRPKKQKKNPALRGTAGLCTYPTWGKK